jgi:tetratricopeptide (TPR) repeat protein
VTIPKARTPPEDAAGGTQIEMHGESRDSSVFIQIGTQFIQPLPPSGLAVRYSLPPDATAFTGRYDELNVITTAVTEAATSSRVVAIHAIGGMPGVGKTALAVHVAHRLRGRFPDQQLFIDLHAHTPGQDPARPEAALAGLLTAAGVDARYLPEDLAGRAGLWRDRMAGQRALLVLDNAASSAQVTPLLPGGEDCLVLVTSRRHLGDLPGVVVPVLLHALPPDQAQEMFLALAPRAGTTPDAAVRELVGLAGCLPLAISLLARVYAWHPSWALADLIRETKASLLTLAAEKDCVAAAFDVSYRCLARGEQEFFCRLGLHPGITTDAYAGAALAGIPLQDAARYLDRLHGEGLLIEAGYRRYGMHDLIRRYSRDHAAADPAAERDQGLEHLLDYYQHTAELAEALLARQSRSRAAPGAVIARPIAVPSLPDRARALSWARAERGNLLACLDYVTGIGHHARVASLTAAVAALLRQDGPWTDAITRHAAAVQAARHLGDRIGEADALTNLGDAHHLTGDYPGATRALEEALGIYRDLGDRLGQAGALKDFGVVRYLTGDYPGGAGALEEALGIYRDLGDQLGQANALNYLGALRMHSGDHPGATEVLDEALRIYRDLGYRLGQANALNDTGVVRYLTRDYPGGAEALEEALGIYRDLGNRLGQAGALNHLGAVRRLTGDYPGAAEALEEALRIYRDLGDEGGEVEVVNQVGTLYRVRGDLDQAGACHQRALDLAREIGSPWDEANALAGLGRCARAAGDAAAAEADLRQALEIFQRIGGGEAADVAADLDALTDTRPAS